jgi:hypothetical protein
MGIWCRHPNQTSPRRDDLGEYCRCLECGARLPWSWQEEEPILHPPILTKPGRKPPSRQTMEIVWRTETKSA